MKNTLPILFTALLAFGCSKKQAIDLVKVGDTAWQDGYVLHVTKRDGTSLVGVTITKKFPGSKVAALSAETATVSPSPLSTNGDAVLIALHNAKAPGGEALGEFPFSLRR